MKENEFQARFLQELRERLPGSIVLKNDECYCPGFPDVTVLHGEHWAVLEMKRKKGAPMRPNQQYYLDKCKDMGGYTAVVYPENREEILRELQHTFQSAEPARVPEPE